MSSQAILHAIAALAVLLSAYGEGHSFPLLPLKVMCYQDAVPTGRATARLLEGMGHYRFQISTPVSEAQRFFDQGLVLAWGFNFGEAGRSFREAARLDLQCAMCRWGIAYALGPSINHDMDDAATTAAFSAIQEARRLARNASPRERGLIEALAKRYSSAPQADRSQLDNAYALAMGEVARRFSDDADVLTLYAEALMTPHGRDYWRKNGTARAWTPKILAVLERALKNSPAHPGANHYYIHILEDSPHPERAAPSAERLRALAPGVGHLVHMPAHVYFRLGNYNAASAACEQAIAADGAYLRASCADPKYVAGYVMHNYHFLWMSAIMAGRSDVAQAAAAELARYVESTARLDPLNGTQQHFLVLPLYTEVRFGRWQAIIAAPRPVAATPYTDGVWHYARGMAYLRTGVTDQARRELDDLTAVRRGARLDTVELKNANPLSNLLDISARLLEAELAEAAGDAANAIAHARSAVRLESELETDEPPAWPMPARHTLGALLLDAGRAAAAERVYRQDLKIHPENGWALAGLAESLTRQGRAAAAAEARRRFVHAWANADVTLSSSRF